LADSDKPFGSVVLAQLQEPQRGLELGAARRHRTAEAILDRPQAIGDGVLVDAEERRRGRAVLGAREVGTQRPPQPPRARIVAVDPAPRADIIDLPGVRVVPSTLQAAPADLFNVLKAGDALFIDSSHILMPGSDADILLNRVLPAAPAGTLVHIHDIFLPFDYPAIWGWRAYNEQQGVVPLLTTGAYRPLFSSAWAERRLTDRLASSVVARLPRPDDALPASLWLEKR